MSRPAAILISLAMALIGPTAWASGKPSKGGLAEMYGAPFSVAVEPKMKVERLPPDSTLALEFSSLVPFSTSGIEIIRLYWPKSNTWCAVCVGLPGQMSSFATSTSASPVIAVRTTSGKPNALDLPETSGAGALTRICAWTLGGESGELIITLSMVSGDDDAVVASFGVTQGGAVRTVSTGGAKTLYGWFEMSDLNVDGVYELITRRSLDGVAGGLFYRAIRSYDAASGSYIPQPEQFRDLFESEVAWLDWVLATQAQIMSDPGPYENKAEVGPRFVAEYEGQIYVFDSIVPLAAGQPGGSEAPASAERALEKVRNYRAELRSWLDGGAAPSTWKMAKQLQ